MAKKVKNADNQSFSNERVKVDAMEYFMNDVFQNYLITKTHLDTKINWLLGICAIIMGLLMPYIIKNDVSVSHFGLFVIAFASLVAFLLGLLSLELPNFFVKKTPEEDSIMFFSRNRIRTSLEIFNELKSIKSYDDVLRQYSITLYNLVERNIKVKNKLFKLGSHVLFIGLVAGFVIILISLFV